MERPRACPATSSVPRSSDNDAATASMPTGPPSNRSQITEVAAIERVEPGVVDREPIKRRRRDVAVDLAVALDLGAAHARRGAAR